MMVNWEAWKKHGKTKRRWRSSMHQGTLAVVSTPHLSLHMQCHYDIANHTTIIIYIYDYIRIYIYTVLYYIYILYHIQPVLKTAKLLKLRYRNGTTEGTDFGCTIFRCCDNLSASSKLSQNASGKNAEKLLLRKRPIHHLWRMQPCEALYYLYWICGHLWSLSSKRSFLTSPALQILKVAEAED